MEKVLTNLNQLPLVSIIIPVYNGGNFLRDAIESALNQTYPNIEVIVVNDGSDDCGETEKIASDFVGKIVYLSKENGGVSSALNFGIQQMKGDFFSWLSHDDLYVETKIEEQLFYFFKDPSIELVYGNYDLWVSSCHFANFCVTANRDFPSIYPLFHLFRRQTNICTCLIRKELFDKIGFFSVNSKTTQDYEFLFKAFRGANCRYINSIFVHTRIHEKQGSKIIPSHILNAEKMWIDFFQKLTKDEYSKLGGFEYFLSDSEKYFKNTPYNSVSTFCKKLKHSSTSFKESFDILFISLPEEWSSELSKKCEPKGGMDVSVFLFSSIKLKPYVELKRPYKEFIFSCLTLEELLCCIKKKFNNYSYIVFVNEKPTGLSEKLLNKLYEMQRSLSFCGVEVGQLKERNFLLNIKWYNFIVRLDYLIKLKSFDSPILSLIEIEKFTKVTYFPNKIYSGLNEVVPELMLSRCINLVFGSNILISRSKLRDFLLTELFYQKSKDKIGLIGKFFLYLKFYGLYPTLLQILRKVRNIIG